MALHDGSNSEGRPYWLIHEPGKTHGFGTIETVGDSLDPVDAIRRYKASLDPVETKLLSGVQMEADLVSLRYDNAGNPIFVTYEI